MLHTHAKARKLLTPLALSALGLLVLVGAGSSGAPAATGLLPEQAVAPTAQERSLAPRVASILPRWASLARFYSFFTNSPTK